MPKESLESLLNKAKELEKKYDWLQAAELYKNASDLALDRKDASKTAELHQKKGYSFYKAAFQAKSNDEFRDLMKLAVQAYKKASELLEGINQEENQKRINHADAMVAYFQCWLETAPAKKKQLITKWWNLENQVLQAYEQAGDMHSVGRICNNLIEYSIYDRFHLVSSYSERLSIYKEGIALAEKAIKIFQRFDDEYELAKVYCFGGRYYTLSNAIQESEKGIKQLDKRTKECSQLALEHAQKIGDAWLISMSNLTSFLLTIMIYNNPKLAIAFAEKALKYGRIAEDNYLIGEGKGWVGASTAFLSRMEEDPDKQKENFNKIRRLSQEAEHHYQIINHTGGMYNSLHFYSDAFKNLAKIEPDLKTKQAILERTIEVIQNRRARFQGWKFYYDRILVVLNESLWLLAETKSEMKEKRKLLLKAQSSIKESIAYLTEMERHTYQFHAEHYRHLAMVQKELANTEMNSTAKLAMLDQATVSLEKGLKIGERKKKIQQTPLGSTIFGLCYQTLGGIQTLIFSLRRDEKSLCKALEAYKQSSVFFEKAEMSTHVAESYWHIAQLYDLMEKQQEASQNYELASQAYELAVIKIPQLKRFYKNYSLYMKAWSQVEEARYSHSLEDYYKAKEHYVNAAENHKASDFWSYLAPNYSAWAMIEEAEDISRKENTMQAKEAFQKALDQFTRAEKAIKLKMENIEPAEEKDLNRKLLQALDLRRRFCQARIQVEEARLMDRKGNHLQSSRNYGEAEKEIDSIIEMVENEAERKELEYLALLCRAWEKMAIAEEATSSESYIEAAELFEKAKEYCYTKKASLWALGNSNFCRGLAAGAEYQTLLNVEDHNRAKGYIQNAATNYFKAGYKTASEYAKGTLRLFDAYLFMNQAERESDTEKRVKQYLLAENLLQLASISFMEAQQPEKAAQVKQILESVRDEKKLAISFNEVLQAPYIASTTQSFAAPSPTSEISVGLEQFQHANVQANLIAGIKEVKVSESFCLSVEFVNAGKEPALLTRVEDFVPQDFIVVEKPEIYRLEGSCLNMKGKQIAPLKLVEAKLVLQPSKKGVYQFKPTVYYLDELGQNKSLQLKSVEIKVEEVLLADRVSTGTKELDSLLLGGIPEEYAVVLTGPPSDEREFLINNFLEAGTGEGQTSFYVTTEAVGMENLLEKSGFYLFLCNPKPKVEVPDLPNVTKLRSKTDINNLNMALARESRGFQKAGTPRRLCIELVSDVLLRQGPEVTRRWLSELITDLGSKGFTFLAVMNPGMHPSDQATAVIDLFDGEISVKQTDDPLECKKSVMVKKLRGQDYIKNPICLKRQT